MRSFYIAIFIAVTILIITSVFVYLSDAPFFNNYSLAERLTLIQNIIAVVGFGLAIFTGWYAANEFATAQLRPNLDLVFENSSYQIIEWCPSDAQREIRIPIYLRNTGRGVGQFIWTTIVFPSALEIVETELPQGWVVSHPQTPSSPRVAEFHGRGEYICYNDTRLNLGDFCIVVEPENLPQSHILTWKIVAQNSALEDGILEIKVTSFEEYQKTNADLKSRSSSQTQY